MSGGNPVGEAGAYIRPGHRAQPESTFVPRNKFQQVNSELHALVCMFGEAWRGQRG